MELVKTSLKEEGVIGSAVGAVVTVWIGLYLNIKSIMALSAVLSVASLVLLLLRYKDRSAAPKMKETTKVSPLEATDEWSQFNKICTPVMVFDVKEDGSEIISWCNLATASVFGYKQDEIMGNSMKVLTDSSCIGQDLLDGISTTGKRRRIDGDQYQVRKIVGKNKEGKELDLLLSIDEVSSHSEERRYIVLLQNVTRLNAYTKRDLEDIKKEKELMAEKHQAFIQSLSVPVIIGKIDQKSPAIVNEKEQFKPSTATKHPIIITECNRAATECFGWSDNELIGKNIEILMPKSVRDVHGRYVDGCIRTNRRKNMGIGRSVTGVTKDGELKELIINMVADKDPQTNIDTAQFTAIFQDFTEIIKQRDASAVLYSCQAQLLQSIAFPGILIDENEKITTSNPVFKDKFGFTTMSDLLGINITDIFPDLHVLDLFVRRDSIAEYPPERQAFSSHVKLDKITAVKHSDAKTIVVNLFVTQTCDANGAIRFLIICEPSQQSENDDSTATLSPKKDNAAIFNATTTSTPPHKTDALSIPSLDILDSAIYDQDKSAPLTKARESTSAGAMVSLQGTEELEIQRKVLSQFTHELRNKYSPSMNTLEAIQSYIDDTSQKPEAFRNEIMSMRDEVCTSLALLNEADELVSTRLELHKIWKGSYVSEPNIETVEIRENMKYRVEAAAILSHSEVNYSAQVPNVKFDGLDIYVRIDMFMFKHIANNLLSNARKACFKGEVILKFHDQVHVDNNDLLEFSVEDTGRGIPDSIATRLFKEEVATADCRGVGLGLTSCKTFSKYCGGDVWLENTKVCTVDDASGGTIFKFRLPGNIVETRTLEYTSPSPRPDPDRRQRKSIFTRSGSQTGIFSRLSVTGGQSPAHENAPYRRLSLMNSTSLQESIDKISAALPSLQPPTPTQSNNDDELRVMTFYLVEDSNVIRRSVISKLRAVSRQIEGADWNYIEFPTVESFLPSLASVVDNNPSSKKTAFVIDENLDSQGGQLKGHELINALVQAGFDGVIISASGDEVSARKHRECGANLIWGKPLPRVPRILETLRIGCNIVSDTPHKRLSGPRYVEA